MTWDSKVYEEFWGQWTAPCHLPSQSEEDLVADIKRVYAKNFPKHDAKTRDLVLLAKFFEVLSDQVGVFHKNPWNINETMYLIILPKE